MYRRSFFALSFISVIGSLFSRSAWSQSLPRVYDAQSLAAVLKDDQVVSAIAADVAFLHSWRIVLTPMGYEGNSEFAKGVTANRIQVFRAAQSQDRAKALETNIGLAMSASKQFSEAFDKNKTKYSKLLTDIGVSPEGQAGQRITNSLYTYAHLNFAMLGAAAQNAEKSSFFWPYC